MIAEMNTINAEIERDIREAYKDMMLLSIRTKSLASRYRLLEPGTKVEVVEQRNGKKIRHLCYIDTGKAIAQAGEVKVSYKFHAAGDEGENTYTPYWRVGKNITTIRPL
jgi:hypothetical protein